jgi:hypothetical protein
MGPKGPILFGSGTIGVVTISFFTGALRTLPLVCHFLAAL